MPMSRYDPAFGGKGGAAKAHAAMVKEYGATKGEEVFYATMNKHKKTMMRGAAMAAGKHGKGGHS